MISGYVPLILRETCTWLPRKLLTTERPWFLISKCSSCLCYIHHELDGFRAVERWSASRWTRQVMKNRQSSTHATWKSRVHTLMDSRCHSQKPWFSWGGHPTHTHRAIGTSLHLLGLWLHQPLRCSHGRESVALAMVGGQYASSRGPGDPGAGWSFRSQIGDFSMGYRNPQSIG